jgi:RNA-directed DNA polymerase
VATGGVDDPLRRYRYGFLEAWAPEGIIYPPGRFELSVPVLSVFEGPSVSHPCTNPSEHISPCARIKKTCWIDPVRLILSWSFVFKQTTKHSWSAHMTNQSKQPSSYDAALKRLQEVGREKFIREEMIRLGFWTDEDIARGADPPSEVARREELTKELRSLRGKIGQLKDEKAVLKAILKKRLEESRKKRQETKERRERDRKARIQAWAERKEHDILYLGPGVSGGLQHTPPDAARLQSLGLPAFDTPESLAAALGLRVGSLRQLAFARPTSTTSNYVRFSIPKKTGGVRTISAPLPKLKAAQRWILDNILALLPLHEAAHGFVPSRSIVSNAAPHTAAQVVINLDLKDFFPTVHWRRVKGLFCKMGYPEAIATILALLCTEPEREQVELDGQRYHVAQTPRFLPQGAPTSPALTNLLCRKLDRRLTGLARSLGFTYTRYADDLTFSATSDEGAGHVGWLIKAVGHVVTAEGFVVHPTKTRVMRRGRHQEVTGLTVNDRVGVPRDQLRRFRATLHQIDRSGPSGKHWQGNADVMASLRGFADFVFMVDPAKGQKLRQQLEEVAARHNLSFASSKSAAKTPHKPLSSPNPQPQQTTPQQPAPQQPTPSPSASQQQQQNPPDDPPTGDDWFKVW